VAIQLKTPEQIERIRRAGRIVRQALTSLGEMIAPGMTTKELDRQAERICLEAGGKCLFKNYPGRDGAGPFPGSICASIDEEVVHGIPSPDRVIVEGQIVSIDFGVQLDGWCADAAETFVVGEVPTVTRRLVEVTRNALAMSISMCRPGLFWSEVVRVTQAYIESEGFRIVRQYVGHGIGREMHEDPKVPNFVSRELLVRDIRLEPGLVLAVEPMVNVGTAETRCMADGWTVVTRDGKPSAHFENTLAITEDGVSVLTQ
jgi:methionyl aminopeptidase